MKPLPLALPAPDWHSNPLNSFNSRMDRLADSGAFVGGFLRRRPGCGAVAEYGSDEPLAARPAEAPGEGGDSPRGPTPGVPMKAIHKMMLTHVAQRVSRAHHELRFAAAELKTVLDAEKVPATDNDVYLDLIGSAAPLDRLLVQGEIDRVAGKSEIKNLKSEIPS